MLVLPKIIINSKEKSSFAPVLSQCKKKNNKVLVIALTFKFKSVKIMKKVLTIHLSNLNLQWIIIRYILSSLGFNKEVFAKRKVNNNVLIKDRKLDKYKFRASFQKFGNLTNYKLRPSKKKENYLN